MDLGFDPTMGGAATVAAILVKLVLFPLVRIRRRRGGEDAATGAFYLHPDLHTPTVLLLLAVGSVVFCAETGEALFPTLSAITTGLLAAMMGHDATGLIRRRDLPAPAPGDSGPPASQAAPVPSRFLPPT